ncbi:MAG: PAS domain-containing protein [Granulosicoccus sp.]
MTNADLVDVLAALDVSQVIIELEVDGTIITANENFLATTGYQLSELKGKHHRIFMHPEDAAHADYKRFWETLASGQHISAECRHIARDGSEFWLQASYNPILDKQGVPYRVMKIATNVTEKRLEKACYESQINAIHRAQAVIEFELDGTICWANDNFLNAVGYTLAQIRGKHHRIFVDPKEHQSAEYRALWEALNRGEFVASQFLRIRKDGSPLWIQATYNPIFDPNGKPVKIIKYASDITDLKLHEHSLAQLLTEANEVMSAIARGDLTQTMQGNYNEMLCTLSESINQTVSQLKITIGQLIENTADLQQGSQSLMSLNTDVFSAASQTSEQTIQISSTAMQVSTTVDEVATALGDMVSSIQEIAQNSAGAVTVAGKAVGLSDDAKANVTQLSDSSNDIGAVIKVINSIADQTNLLALNATIEAARAGDAGKGFAVVANEVKELAKETARATEEVSQKITKIQDDSQSAARIINEISETIETISNAQNSIAATVEEQRAVSAGISRSINETAAGTKQIASNMSNTAEVARENQNRAERSQTTASELSGLSDRLGGLASKFKLE